MSTLRFGKHPPKRDYRTLRFGDYLTPALPKPAASHDVLEPVFANLRTSDASALFPMDGNDAYGDCTIAAVAHASTVYHGLVRNRRIMPRADVIKLYLRLTGGIDSGLVELDVLNYWRKHVVSGDEIVAYVSVDPRNHTHVKQAITLFGGVYLGFQVQQDCIDDFNAGRTWTPGPLTTDGHAVHAVAYDRRTVTVLTWGSLQRGSWAWWDECVDEAYAIVPPEAHSRDFAPGFSYARLMADLQAVAG